MSNQKKFRELLASGGYTQKMAADIISDETKKIVSQRTIRAWLTPEDKPSSRPCPDWAVFALEKKLRRLRKII